MTDSRPGVVIGAFERDNFGDILFWQRTAEYLAGAHIVAAAPVAGDTRSVGGTSVRRVADVFASEDARFVWTVGGEAGGTSLANAVGMAFEASSPGHRSDSPPTALTGLSEASSPYIPRPSRYENARGAVQVINSAGLSGIVGLHGTRRTEIVATLREADFISVRDARSVAALNAIGLQPFLAPDLVHSFRLSMGPPILADALQQSPRYALFQIKERLLEKAGIDHVARALTKITALRDLPLRLFSAGEAPGHDSTEKLRVLAAAITTARPGMEVEISKALRAEDKFAEIANAELWIGTSLHGFIISMTYGVPRVGMFIPKLKNYADTWDDQMPTTVDLQTVDQACSYARSSAARGAGQAAGERLARLADLNMQMAVEKALNGRREVRPIPSRRLPVQVSNDRARGTKLIRGARKLDLDRRVRGGPRSRTIDA